ncbi:polysaccharide deacetylase family protein [bacterium]|nr:polysaccharide deacetylase family protein [bacterium]
MSIPVLMYHHVNELKDKFTISPDDFQTQMEYLARKNYQTLFLNELIDSLKKGKDKRRMVLTFDDGYLDNWVYAYPILKKYNLKATIFVITSRIKEKSSSYHPHLGNVWNGESKKEDLPKISNHYQSNLRCVRNSAGSDDHISWEEAKKMSQSGLIDIQSHSHLHSYCYVSHEIVGYCRGDKWRTGWLTDGDLRLGIPLYEDKPALAGRKYSDDRDLRDGLAEYVSQRGKEKFFEKRDWKKELDGVASDYRAGNRLKDNYETLEKRKKRIENELLLSKNIIEKKVDKKCPFIAWPGGAYDNDLVKWAKECGYLGAVTTQPGTNTSNTDPMYLKRFEVKKENLGWFKRRLFIYSHNLTASFYSKMPRL